MPMHRRPSAGSSIIWTGLAAPVPSLAYTRYTIPWVNFIMRRSGICRDFSRVLRPSQSPSPMSWPMAFLTLRPGMIRMEMGAEGKHDGNRLPAADAAKNIPDIGYWRGIVQAFEKKAAGTSYIDGQGNTQRVSNPHTPTYAVPNDIQMSQIMGSAYWARTHDIRGTGWTEQPDKQRPGLRVKTFAFDVNEGGNQNNDAWRRNFNQLFMAAKYGGFETDPFNPRNKPYKTKGNPFQDQTGNFNDDVWQKTNDPGEAATYYVFNTAKPKPARDLLNAFDDIFSRGSVVTRSVAGGSMNTGRKLSTNPDSPSVIYSATFDTSNWSGDVVAEKIILNASQANAPVLGPPLWRAATQLGAPSAVTRKIFITQASSSTRSAVV